MNASTMDHDMKSYTQIDSVLKDEEFRKKTRKRLIIITISTVVLVTIIVAAILGTLAPQLKKASSTSSTGESSTADSIRAVCQVTLYPDSCSSSLSAISNSSSSSSSSSSEPPRPQQIFVMSLQVALRELLNLSSSYFKLSVNNSYDPVLQGPLRNCEYLISDAVDHVNISLLSANRTRENYNTEMISDMRTWLSTAITNQETCLDGLEESGAVHPTEYLWTAMQNSREFTSNSLAIITNLFKTLSTDSPSKVVVMNGLLKPNVTVAKDGSGNFTTINEALVAISRNSSRKKLGTRRYVVYVKEGVYEENVIVGKDLYNVTMYGDGMNRTIVSGSLNVVDGSTTFDSATFIAEGSGFIGIDMGFKNTAGPDKEQAVALRSSSDHSIFYRCSFDGYQDTLYTYSNRQFYRDCHITGTIDFIFGNAAVIFQNCNIVPRQPLPKQFNAITAQSKSDPNQNTGISIQRSRINNSLTATTRTYLGRPWKNYSTTIFMESDIGGVVDPAGWRQWTPDVDPPNTIFYAEYRNTGPGSLLNRRVNWGGYRPNLPKEEANKFSVESFIHGSTWLTAANVPFDAD